ncbi:MAG: methylated-DNA--[protein]-cysteine S-methyltransferase [Deltaproteobacteria bacterium]|nr:MAG: methylated-DNA--[protein]-cysteine S-methyltransferase [Deltaproteobacteria bacterium]
MNLPWDIDATAFRDRVWKSVCTIPYGETRTYKDIAAMVGTPKGARAVGQALNKNPLLILIPCHRVVAADGLGGFGSGIELKKYLLSVEQG